MKNVNESAPRRPHVLQFLGAAVCRPVVGVGLLLCVCWGCGTNAYEKRLDERLKRIKHAEELAEKYKKLSAPVTISNTPVSMCILQLAEMGGGKPSPLCIDGKRDGKDFDPRRAGLPEQLKLPIPINVTYEPMTDIPGSNKQLSLYCYFAAAKMPEGEDLDSVAGKLRRQLAEAGKTIDVVNLEIEARDGRMQKWLRVRCECPQEFFIRTKGAQGKMTESFEKMPGVLEIYLHEEKGYLIIICGRFPAAIEMVFPTTKIIQWASVIAGGVTVK